MGEEENKRKYARLLEELMRTIRVYEPHLSPEEQMLLWERIAQGSFLRAKRQPRRLWQVPASVAASLLVLLGFYFFNNSYYQNIPIDYQSIVNKSTNETPVNVRLVSSEKMLDIEGNNVELVYDKKGEINIPTETEVNINTNPTANVSPNVDATASTKLNQLIVPYGKTSSVILSDGTKIWVNSGSRLIYPSVFAENKREIFVEGEIYLEVTKNEKHPFVVKTGDLEINVLGTSFNVSAYKGEKKQSIVLVTGSVSVKNNTKKEAVQIEPNEIYDYETDSREFHIEKIDIYDYICWKYGFFHFRSKELITVLEHLRKYYNVNIEYDRREIANVLVSGKLDLKENITDVLNLVALTANIQFEKRDDKIVITLKK
jgi:hypothetical protein